MACLRLTTLGGFEARDAAGRAIEIAGTRAQAILAVLALRPGVIQSRDKLMALLWSERGESQARGSLRHAIWALRRALAPLHPCPLVIEGESLSLDPDAVEADVSTLERSAMDGSADALRTAVAVYAGDFLDGIRIRDPAFEQFLRLERERIHELFIDVCSRLMNDQMQHESLDSAAQTARRLLEIDALQEPARRVLMRYHAAKGQVSLALKHYQICRDTLRNELQVEPDAETERLFNEIRLSRPCVAIEPEQPERAKPPAQALPAAQQDTYRPEFLRLMQTLKPR